MRKINLSILSFFVMLFNAGLASAQFRSRGYSRGLEGSIGNAFDYVVNSYLIRHVLVFLFFYFVLFFALSKTFKEKRNRGIAAILSVILSLFVTFTIAQRNILYGYIGESIGTWTLVFAFIIGVAILLKVAYDRLGKVGMLVFLWILFIIGWFFDPVQYLPYSSVGDFILNAYYLTFGWLGFIALVVVTAVLSFWNKKDKKP